LIVLFRFIFLYLSTAVRAVNELVCCVVCAIVMLSLSFKNAKKYKNTIVYSIHGLMADKNMEDDA